MMQSEKDKWNELKMLLESTENLFSRIEMDMDKVSEEINAPLDCSDYEMINPGEFKGPQMVESEMLTSIMSSSEDS